MYNKKAALKSFENLTEKNLCMSLFLNKVAGLQTDYLLSKKLLYTCFPVSFSRYLENLYCKTRPGDCFCKISFGFSRQPQQQNVTIDCKNPKQLAINMEI